MSQDPEKLLVSSAGAEERFRLLVESVKDYAIFLLDPQGCVATWNVGAERIKGYRASEIIGQHFSRFYLPEEAASGKCEYELEVASHEGRFEDEGWRLRKDGSRFWANVVITAVIDAGGTLLGFTKVTRDLTERKQLEEERLQLAHAQEAIRLRDEFLSIASHELRTPLTALHLQLQALNETGKHLDAKYVKRLQRALTSSERLGDLVEALLSVSRIASGRLDLKPSAQDLAQIAREAAERFVELAERTGTILTVDVPETIPGVWDPLRIEQAIVNLIANALKYAPGAPVELTLRVDGPDAVLTLRDHGPGIPEADLRRIFARFERAASLRHYGGLGLGLYVTDQIVRAHGGEAFAENADGGGARFVLRIPTQRVANLAVPEPALNPSARR